jgi:VWFA-related protein
MRCATIKAMQTLATSVQIGLMLCAALRAQGSAQQSQQQSPLQSAAAPVVNLNVVAKDARGQPVTDLTREDFQVFEGSKPQRVISFRRNDGSVKRVMRAEPGEYSNREGTPMSRVTVILFDLLNARFEDRGYMLNQLTPALQHAEGSDTLFLYILTMDGTLHAVHGLADAHSGSPRPADAHPWTDDIKVMLDDASRELFHLRPVIDVDSRVRMTYKALGMMGERVAAAQGRKSLIWISHGVPISLGPQSTTNYGEIDYTPLLQRLTATLDRAQVAVYTVRQPASMRPGSGGVAADQARPGADASGITLATEDTLDQFAGLTGGHAFMTPDIRGAIARAALDSRMSYLITYEPPEGGWDGKYHKIRVTTTRKGVKLEAKQGYYAFADLAAEGDREKAAFESIASSSFDATEIGVFAKLDLHSPDLHSLPARTVELSIRLDAADLHYTKAGDVETGQVAVSVAGYLKDGRVEMFPVDELLPKLTAGEPDKILHEGIRVEKRLVLAEGVEKLRVLVYDRASGAVGSLALALEKTTPLEKK